MDTYRPIELRFIRRAADGTQRAASETDDVLTITKVRENCVRCRYCDKSSSPPAYDITTFTYQQLMAHLVRIFCLLSLDDDPFHSVQFFLPCYPTILIPVSRIQQNSGPLLEVVMQTCTVWPLRTVEPATVISSAESEHSSFAEEEDDDEHNNDDDEVAAPAL